MTPRDSDLSELDWTLSDPRHPLHVAHMEMALAEARAAASADEVPVGAVIVSRTHGVIGSAHNERETLHDPTAHAEMLAITQAAQALHSWRPRTPRRAHARLSTGYRRTPGSTIGSKL
jgi:tRNA(adenine34) deaminase